MVSLSLSPLATSMAGRALASPPSQVQTFSWLIQLWTPPLLSPPPLMSSLLLTKGRRQEPTAPNILQRDGDDDGLANAATDVHPRRCRCNPLPFLMELRGQKQSF